MSADEPTVEPAELPVIDVPIQQPLEPVEYLVRASLDLRGVRPSIDEVEAVLGAPERVHDLVASFADDDRLGRRVSRIFNEVFLTYLEDPFVDLSWFRAVVPKDALVASIGQEPLEVLGHIVDEDLSYAELVTADWTMTNESLAAVWPVSYEATSGWVKSRYTDGRPAAGVLSSNGMWWQYGSMLNNLNRGRANAFSRIFLCRDYLDNEIGFDPDRPLDSEEAMSDAIRSDPACAGCHDSLDPLAAHFYGFWFYSGRKKLPSEVAYYHPDREQEWRRLGGLPPAYKGDATSGLEDLGRRTAEDPAYARCFVERSFEGMLRRELLEIDEPVLEDAEARFVASGLNVRELYRYIVQSSIYQEGGGEVGRKVAAPSVLGSQVEELTGFAWSRGGLDLMRAPESGFAALAGGVDGVFRSVRAEEPFTTVVLTQKRLAESASMWVAARDLEGTSPRLLTQVDATMHPGTHRELFIAQLQALHLQILSERADDAAIADELELWEMSYFETNDATQAWAAVLSLLLRDPRVLVY